VVCRTLETVIHKVEENAQDLHELQSQVGMKHSALMTEREQAADARDQALKCTLNLCCLLADELQSKMSSRYLNLVWASD